MSAAVAVDTAMLTPWYLFAADALRTTDVARLRGWIEDLAEGEAPPGIAAVPVWQQALGGDAAALEREYVRLFLHPAGAPCPPWQSVGPYEKRPCALGLELLRQGRQVFILPRPVNDRLITAGAQAATSTALPGCLR